MKKESRNQLRVQSPESRGQSSTSQHSHSRPQTLDPRLFSSPQRWHCLSVAVPHDVAEAVANFLLELGSTGIVEGERDFLQPLSTTTVVQGFFPLTDPGPTICRALTQYLRELSALFPGLGAPVPLLTKVTSEAWTEQWREHFPPIQVGSRLLILPPWTPSPSHTDRIVIIINPSMAFGTGHHATTQGCLEAIESLCATDSQPATALDLGTGSGILAIALAKFGAQVWATDIDPIALEEAGKNIAANQVTSLIHLGNASFNDLPAPFPLIVANLFATTLVTLAPTLERMTEANGHLILSGIQIDQEAEVRAAYSAAKWLLVQRWVREEWVIIVLRRN